MINSEGGEGLVSELSGVHAINHCCPAAGAHGINKDSMRLQCDVSVNDGDMFVW